MVVGVVAHRGLHAQAPAPTSLEYQVKAAYVLNFVSFTEWPGGALGAAGTPLRICVAGDDPFGGTLENTIKGEVVLGHPLTVERLTRNDAARHCQVLFVSRNDKAQGSEVLRAITNAPILTIGESPAFLRNGGIINLVIDQGFVRFDINRQLAEQRGLKLSSRLLRIARSVM